MGDFDLEGGLGEFRYENELEPGVVKFKLDGSDQIAVGLSSHPSPADGKTPEIRLAFIDTTSGRELSALSVPAVDFFGLVLSAQEANILPWVRFDQYK